MKRDVEGCWWVKRSRDDSDGASEYAKRQFLQRIDCRFLGLLVAPPPLAALGSQLGAQPHTLLQFAHTTPQLTLCRVIFAVTLWLGLPDMRSTVERLFTFRRGGTSLEGCVLPQEPSKASRAARAPSHSTEPICHTLSKSAVSCAVFIPSFLHRSGLRSVIA